MWLPSFNHRIGRTVDQGWSHHCRVVSLPKKVYSTQSLSTQVMDTRKLFGKSYKMLHMWTLHVASYPGWSSTCNYMYMYLYYELHKAAPLYRNRTRTSPNYQSHLRIWLNCIYNYTAVDTCTQLNFKLLLLSSSWFNKSLWTVTQT